MRCLGSGAVYDDSYRKWRYPQGLPTVKCERCGARRKLQIRKYHYAKRMGGIEEHKVFFPYHDYVQEEHSGQEKEAQRLA